MRQRDVLVLGRVRGDGVRAVLGEPVRVGLRGSVQHERQLLGARTVQRDDGVVHVLLGMDGRGLLCGGGMCGRRGLRGA